MVANKSTEWVLFLASLSGRSASTPRVRLWRALKELGATTLRDGVTLLPASNVHRARLEAIGEQVETEGGVAWLFELPAQDPAMEDELRRSFDRSEAYRDLGARLAAFGSELPKLDDASARRRLRQLERDFEAIAGIDFFPGEAREQSRQALEDLTALTNRRFSPEGPSAAGGSIEQLDVNRYRGRRWATRRRIWVDRVASAWLIRRFIDAEARFVWLESPQDCPDDSLGFDFEGAAFTHVGERVTFEVLVASFGLDDDPGLARLGRLVHYLDAGGLPVAEAAGFKAVLAGLRETAPDDDALLALAASVLDALYRFFTKVT